MGRAFVEEVFQGRETMGVTDVGIEGSDINSSQKLFTLGKQVRCSLNMLMGTVPLARS